MRVLVTGSSGYIGFAVACAFARAGHDVLGLVRSAAKGERLAAREVLPVVGALDDPHTFADAARASEVIVHCASMGPDLVPVGRLVDFAKEARLPRRLIYTSGVWVYGSTGARLVDESSALAPFAKVAWRPEVEHAVLAADAGPLGLRTVVIRPGCVYGGAGSLTASWFSDATSKGAAAVVGDGANRWTMVHLEDLADLYVRAASSSVGGEVFNATDRSRSTVLDCARAASAAAGVSAPVRTVPVEDARLELGAYADCLAADQHVDSRKAAALLGWQPRHGGFVDGAPRYHAAWQAHAGRTN